ncbi:hypothetical protein [Sporisorium scitamineum]|uniref:Arrestin-like N-terminal domain-containing protein n=1 Tax=Sporisorium scitamineum TaxID=49012 RepID=A0A0F7S973_9BASI|nr:hypothetical protein [Sporisorium scitamineum]
MKLRVSLSSPVLVMPSSSRLYKQEISDAPPSYDKVTLNYESTPLLPSTSPPSSHASTSASSLDSQTILRAHITITVPSDQQAAHVLTSLTASLKAFESLAHNNGGFQQSQPVDLRVSVPLPSQHVSLLPGKMYNFQAEIVCPDDMPPSVQLPDARLRYKVIVRAKTIPAVFSHSRLASLLRGTTLTDSIDLTVLQAVEVESHDGYHCNNKRISIQDIGPLCISTTPRSPCIIGTSTTIHLSLPHSPTHTSSITNVELRLSQDSYIRWRNSTSPSKPAKIQPTTTSQAQFHIPHHPELQPSTLANSNTLIHTSHQLNLILHFSDPSTNQPRSFECSWPITLAPSEAGCQTLSDRLPAYTPAEPTHQPSSVTLRPVLV